jgi:hypothetical protein
MDPVWVVLVALPLLFLWIVGAVDVVRRRDMSALTKTFWILVMLIVPILGLLLYFFVRPHDASLPTKGETGGEAGSRSVASELEALEAKRESGAISEEEFQAAKLQVLGFDRT